VKKQKILNQAKFPIGAWVKFKKHVVFKVDNSYSIYSKRKKEMIVRNLSGERKGQIIGGTYKQTGTIEYESGDFETGIEGYNYFVRDKSYPVYFVRTGYTTKPLLVRPEDIEYLASWNEDTEYKMPYRTEGKL